MKAIDLEDLIPMTGEFSLEATGAIVHQLRPITLQDQVWIKDKFGDAQALQKILEGTKLKELCQLIYHQLLDKSHFRASVVKEINDEGDEVERKITGPEALASCVSTKKEQLAIYKALLKTIGVSEPMLEEVLGGGESAKKKQPSQPQPSSNEVPAGEKSST